VKLMPAVIAMGEVLVEIMRPDAMQPLDQPGQFLGPYPSGAPAIFIVAAARLGLDTGFIGAVGADAFGRLMRATFQAEDVDASQLQTPPGYATGAAFVAYDSTGEREFVFHIRQAAAGQLSADLIQPHYFQGVHWLHISGSTLFLNAGCLAACQRAMELTLSQNGKISVDPNLRFELMPLDSAREVLRPFLAAADLVLPTLGEAQALSGQVDPQAAVGGLGTKMGAVVALKNGPKGCSIFQAGEQMEIPGYAVTEIDPTGAGDCFSAAFMAGLEAGWPLKKVSHYANAAGALAVTRMGPMGGAPTHRQVMDLLGE
jgi:sugar/nucleoside kinase (ribokinase family)